jgi:hypothetical protein
MVKMIRRFLQSEIGILIAIITVISIFTWLYLKYTHTRDISYKYDGIKYQAGNLEVVENISIEIKGKYAKSLFGKKDSFIGTIRIGDKTFNDNNGIIYFGKEKWSSLIDANGISYATIYYSGIFKKITLTLYEKSQDGNLVWNANNGLLISAPSKTRVEAVEISNSLLHKKFGFVIE